MKIIDLLNKIANGEEVPKRIKYDSCNYLFLDGVYERTDNYDYLFDSILIDMLNDEVEIIEEEKKIPEKIKIEEKSIIVKGTTFFREKDIEIFQKLSMEINEIIDYLKSKGE